MIQKMILLRRMVLKKFGVINLGRICHALLVICFTRLLSGRERSLFSDHICDYDFFTRRLQTTAHMTEVCSMALWQTGRFHYYNNLMLYEVNVVCSLPVSLIHCMFLPVFLCGVHTLLDTGFHSETGTGICNLDSSHT